jgi:hypothetical protein
MLVQFLPEFAENLMCLGDVLDRFCVLPLQCLGWFCRFHVLLAVARDGLSYAAFFRFIFPCAQRCFSSRDSFLRAAALILRTGLDARDCFAFAHRARWAAAILARPAALMRSRLRGMAAALGGRPALPRPVEFKPSIAAIARSMRPRSVLSSAIIRSISIKSFLRAAILTATLGFCR